MNKIKNKKITKQNYSNQLDVDEMKREWLRSDMQLENTKTHIELYLTIYQKGLLTDEVKKLLEQLILNSAQYEWGNETDIELDHDYVVIENKDRKKRRKFRLEDFGG